MLHYSATFGIFVLMETNKRKVLFYGNYFQDFFIQLNSKTRDKIIWTLDLICELVIIPETYLKHIEGTHGLYEIRVKQGNNIYRIFCFFEKGNVIIIVSGFQKKTQKTPKKEIEKALRIKKEYEEEKE